MKLRKVMIDPPSDAGRWMRGRNIRPIPITERMLLRHGWYRRKLRKEGVAIDPDAKNSVAFGSGFAPKRMVTRAEIEAEYGS
jgi:ribosomal protein L11 methylase PrmA